MEDLNLYKNLFNENYTDIRNDEIIAKVFENKQKSVMSKKSEAFKFAKGGGVNDEHKVYTPYEFMYELLPKVYGRPYVVSDDLGEQYNREIEQAEIKLNEYTNEKLVEYGVASIYKIDNKTLLEEIEIRRRKIISDKTFITETELEAYLFCHPELNYEHYVAQKPAFDIERLRGANVIMVDYDSKNNTYKYVYVYEYLSGDIYNKITRLKQYKENLINLALNSEGKFKFTEEDFTFQENQLNKNLPTQGKITKDLNTCLFILPKSKFAENFMIAPEDVQDINMSYSRSFYDVFKSWTETELNRAVIVESRNLTAVHTYFTDLKPKSKFDDDATYSDSREKAFNDGRRILLEFMTKGLTSNCQQRLEIEWNGKYNSYTEPKYYKLPVACHLSNKFKNGKDFVPNETQVQSLQFLKSVGSGLLAYGVGVGKTASAIMNISFALDNNRCNKPLLIVPNATYQKWKMEMFGGVVTIYNVEYKEGEKSLNLTFDNEKKAQKFSQSVNGKIKQKVETIYGHLGHIKNYVELYNLSEPFVKKVKNYSDNDLLQIQTIDELIEYLKTVPKDYVFDNSVINQKIKSLYDDFEAENVIRDYNTFIDEDATTWWDKLQNKQQFNWSYSVGKDYYIKNIATVSLKQFFEKGIRKYREELPFILGTLKTFEKGTVFLATYEALEHLGLVLDNNTELFDDDSFYGEIFREISQGDLISNANYDVQKNTPVLYRNSVYGKYKTKLDIRALGFDYAVFDESHLLKKVIMDCKGIPTWGTRGGSGTANREDRKYGFGKGEYPSTTGLTGYFITRFIQKEQNGSNVVHLTATPFTNKPAEIYSMLSLTNRKMLEKSEFMYMEQFFDVYMDISFELIFGNTGVQRKESLLGYRNLPQLRNLIYSMMDYKSGEDANIKRPEKLLFPSVEKNIQTTIPETPLQDELFKQIKNYQRGRIEYAELCADSIEVVDVDELSEDELLTYILESGTDTQKTKYETIEKPLEEDELDELKKAVSKILLKSGKAITEENLKSESEKDAFRVVKGLTLLKSVTLSPYLSVCQKQAGVEPTYIQYVESSPKLMYTIKCIESIHKYELQNNLRKSGCVIYMNLGVKVSYTYTDEQGKKVTVKWSESGFDKIKQYLVAKLGYSADEISLVYGGLNPIEKERAKNKFLSGQSTVLIGSQTISTGVDLQNNASALFLCAYDWNPTDNEQISGRIHRQGNRFSKIRIVYPMVMNSADPNIFQQLYEKTLRIKNIWDRNDTGNTLDLRDFDVDSLRKGILDEPEDLAVYWRETQTKELQKEDKVLENSLNDLRNARADKDIIDNYTPVMKGIIVVLDAYKKYKNKKELEERYNEKIGDAQSEYDENLAELTKELQDGKLPPEPYTIELNKLKNKLNKAKEKLGADFYDFQTDPEGKFRTLTYDEIGDGDELLKKVNNWITNSDSYFSRFSYEDKRDIYVNWLEKNIPRFNKGFYNLSKDESEDIRYYVDFDGSQPINWANKWKGAYRGFNKVKENLVLLGVEFEEIPQATELIIARQEEIKNELELIKQQFPQKLEEYILAKEQRILVQPTIEQRVEEFSSYNSILKETVVTFAEDKSKFVEIPSEKIKEIKPKKEEKTIEEKIKEAVTEEEIEQESKAVDTSNLIENLKNGMIARFNLGKNVSGYSNIVDLFFDEGEYVKYIALEDKKGNVVDDSEEILTENEAIEFYSEKFDMLLEEFFDSEEEQKEEEIEVKKPVQTTTEKSKAEIYKQLIQGYELSIDIEDDEEKIKIFKDLIDGYELALELEN